MIDPRVHIPLALFEFIICLPSDRQHAALDAAVESFRAAGDFECAAAFDVEARLLLADWRARGCTQVGHA